MSPVRSSQRANKSSDDDVTHKSAYIVSGAFVPVCQLLNYASVGGRELQKTDPHSYAGQLSSDLAASLYFQYRVEYEAKVDSGAGRRGIGYFYECPLGADVPHTAEIVFVG